MNQDEYLQSIKDLVITESNEEIDVLITLNISLLSRFIGVYDDLQKIIKDSRNLSKQDVVKESIVEVIESLSILEVEMRKINEPFEVEELKAHLDYIKKEMKIYEIRNCYVKMANLQDQEISQRKLLAEYKAWSSKIASIIAQVEFPYDTESFTECVGKYYLGINPSEMDNFESELLNLMDIETSTKKRNANLKEKKETLRLYSLENEDVLQCFKCIGDRIDLVLEMDDDGFYSAYDEILDRSCDLLELYNLEYHSEQQQDLYEEMQNHMTYDTLDDYLLKFMALKRANDEKMQILSIIDNNYKESIEIIREYETIEDQFAQVTFLSDEELFRFATEIQSELESLYQIKSLEKNIPQLVTIKELKDLLLFIKQKMSIGDIASTHKKLEVLLEEERILQMDNSYVRRATAIQRAHEINEQRGISK